MTLSTFFPSLAGRRSLLAVVLWLALPFWQGCDRDPPPPLPGQVAQPASAVVSGDHLFVASPPADALSVLDLTDESASYLRAPNPLFALEIPAVRRPSLLRAVPAGEPDERNLVLAFSSVDRQMRVIDADAMMPVGSPVTLPGWPVAADVDRSGTVLVAVAWPEDGDDPGALVVIELSPEAQARGGSIDMDEAPIVRLESEPLGFVPGGLAASNLMAEPLIWISDLFEPRLLRLELATGETEEVHTGAPLSSLVASPEAVFSPDTVPRGRYVYGLTSDGFGFVSLDAELGGVSPAHVFDGEVRPMPLTSRGLSLTVTARVFVDLGLEEDVHVVQVPFLVLIASVDGRMMYIDGTRMAPIDLQGRTELEPSVAVTPAANVKEEDGYGLDLDRSAPVLETTENPDYVVGGAEPPLVPAIELSPGVTRTRTWHVSWRAEIPGRSPALGSFELVDDEARVLPIAPVVDRDERVVPGDRLTVVSGALPDRPGCGAFSASDELIWEVVSVDPADAGMVVTVLEGGAPLPDPACFEETFAYRLHAGGYMVTADDLDEVFRVEPGEGFEYRGERFMRTALPEDGPELAFVLAEEQDEEAMVEGAQRRLRVSSGIDILSALPDAAGLGVARASVIGEPAVYRPDTSTYGTGRVFVPYAGPGYLISFDVRTRGGQRAHR